LHALSDCIRCFHADRRVGVREERSDRIHECRALQSSDCSNRCGESVVCRRVVERGKDWRQSSRIGRPRIFGNEQAI
jgi:hypothetical protein